MKKHIYPRLNKYRIYTYNEWFNASPRKGPICTHEDIEAFSIDTAAGILFDNKEAVPNKTKSMAPLSVIPSLPIRHVCIEINGIHPNESTCRYVMVEHEERNCN